MICWMTCKPSGIISHMIKAKRYILVGRKAVEEPDLSRWEGWFSHANRIVKSIDIPVTEENRFLFKITVPHCVINVSTVFLGIDHALYGARPLLYETKITGGQYDQRRQWTHTWDEAETEHQFMVEALLQGGFTCLLRKFNLAGGA